PMRRFSWSTRRADPVERRYACASSGSRRSRSRADRRTCSRSEGRESRLTNNQPEHSDSQFFPPRSDIQTMMHRKAFLYAALGAACTLTYAAEAQSPPRPGPSARTADQLTNIVRWGKDDAPYTVVLPASLDSAIRRVVPGYRVRRDDEFVYATTH